MPSRANKRDDKGFRESSQDKGGECRRGALDVVKRRGHGGGAERQQEDGWIKHVDEASGRSYLARQSTGEVKWADAEPSDDGGGGEDSDSVEFRNSPQLGPGRTIGGGGGGSSSVDVLTDPASGRA